MCAHPINGLPTAILCPIEILKEDHDLVIRAARTGFFYIKMPESCQRLISKGIEFANTFYKNETLKKLDLDGIHQYHDLGAFQTLPLENRYWKTYLPSEMSELATQMHQLATEILDTTLSVTTTSDSYSRELISGRVTEGKGESYLTVNHYPKNSPIYASSYVSSDNSQVSLLYIDQEGLQILFENKWIDIPSHDDYFVVFFGRALEYTINDQQQVKSCWHRVRRHASERISFQVDATNGPYTQLYIRGGDILINTGKTFQEALSIGML